MHRPDHRMVIIQANYGLLSTRIDSREWANFLGNPSAPLLNEQHQNGIKREPCAHSASSICSPFDWVHYQRCTITRESFIATVDPNTFPSKLAHEWNLLRMVEVNGIWSHWAPVQGLRLSLMVLWRDWHRNIICDVGRTTFIQFRIKSMSFTREMHDFRDLFDPVSLGFDPQKVVRKLLIHFMCLTSSKFRSNHFPK